VTQPVPVCTLSEWQTATLPDLALSAADRKLVAELTGGQGGRLDIDELRQGIRVRARSWVGVVRFQNFEVRITPKLAGGNARLVDMLRLTSGLDALRRNRSRRYLQVEQSIHLFDLIALLFAEACERIVQGGLLHDYVERESDLPVLRGRLLVGEQVRWHYGRVDRLACRYDDHLTDIVDNQIVAAALSLCRSRVSHPAVRLHVHRLHTLFTAACSEEKVTDLKGARAAVHYHRFNEHYREAHELAWLLFDGMGVDDLLQSGPTQSFAFLLDMNRLYERFIARFVAFALQNSDYRIQAQRQDRSIIWDMMRNKPYTSIVPDLLIKTSDGRRLAVDSKYKLYDERQLSTADIYQSFLYAYAYNDAGNRQPAAVLIYPASEQHSRPTYLQIRGQDRAAKARLHALSISIPDAIAEIDEKIPGPLSKALLEAVEQLTGGGEE
jgi:5-methylcytosine-specific restriction enzyme subunit McrC